MKVKMQVVVNCGDCDHCGVTDDNPYCEINEMRIKNTFGIPDMCPLPDVEIKNGRLIEP